MKLLLILTSMPSLKGRGGSSFSAVFIEELSRRGVNVTVIRLRSINPMRALCSKTILNDNIVCYTICAFLPPVLSYPVLISAVFRHYLKRLCLDYDVVHAGNGWVAIAANIAAENNSSEYIIQFIGDDVNSDLVHLIRSSKYINALNEARFHIFNAAKLLRVFKAIYPSSKVATEVVKRGVRLDEFRYHYNLVDEINFVFLGGVPKGNEKGFFTLIEAIRLIDKEIIDNKINIIVGGPSTIKYKGIIKIENNKVGLNFVGEVSRNEVIELLKAANVVLIPSLNEGIPNVLYEAMAAGNMVIATDVGGVSEVMQNGVSGWLITPNSPNALADAIINASRKKNDLINYARNGRRIIEELSYDNFVSFYMHTYSVLTDSNGTYAKDS